MERFKEEVTIIVFIAIFCVCMVIKSSAKSVDDESSVLKSGQIGRKAQGTVFHDRNANGIRDENEPGLPGVRVSDQISVTVTDSDGNWELPERDEAVYFVIKPQGYMTALSKDNIPRFYYLHRNIKQLKLQGPTVPRSGPLPQSIDFPLIEQAEPDKFEVIFMGDPQPANIEQVNYLGQDVLEELVDTKAAFAITLGDLTYDELGLYPYIMETCGAVGIPFYNTPGNHDANYDGLDPYQHYETWRATFGPGYYSFDYGPVHFVILNDVTFPEKGNMYKAGFGESQLEWLEQDLTHVPMDQTIVLSMHIPLRSAADNSDFARLYELLKDRPNTLSFSAHTHTLTHIFLDDKQGWKGAEPHHHINAGATCGRWWGGNKDETNIPHATSSDGTPNGYFVITFNGYKYSTRYKAARKPEDYQMQIQTPAEVKQWRLADTPVFVNVFNGSIQSSVKMAVGKNGKWIDMNFAPQPDPLYSEVTKRENGGEASKCNHIWEGRLPAGLGVGGHVVRIRTVDMHGQAYTGSRIIRINDEIPLVSSSHDGTNITNKNKIELRLTTDYPGGIIRYTLDDTEPTGNSAIADSSIDVSMDAFTTKRIKSRIFALNGKKGRVKNIVFIQIKENYAKGCIIKANMTNPSQKYAQGDMSILVDGQFGGPNFGRGWLGWEGNHADFIIDLGETRTISRVFTRAVTDENSWIFFPKAVKAYLSQDGKNWSEPAMVKTSKPIRIYGFEVQEYNIKVAGGSARYIRVVAENILKNPEWHTSPGGNSWVFLDEVIVE